MNKNGYLFLYGQEKVPSFEGNPYHGHRTEFLSLEKQYLHFLRRRGIPKTAKSTRQSDIGTTRRTRLSQVLSNIPDDFLSLSERKDDNNQNCIEELHDSTEQVDQSELKEIANTLGSFPNQDSEQINIASKSDQPSVENITGDLDSTSVNRTANVVQPLLEKVTDDEASISKSSTLSKADKDVPPDNITAHVLPSTCGKVPNPLAPPSTISEVNDDTNSVKSPSTSVDEEEEPTIHPSSVDKEIDPKLNEHVQFYLHGSSNLDAIDVEGESSLLPYEVLSDYRSSVIKNFKMSYKNRTLKSLQPKKWLNDCTINYFMSCLNISAPKENIIVLDSQLIGTVGKDIAKMERSTFFADF